MKNSIFVINPYKWNGMWVFDDERVGLDKEPFVAGADTMIDTAVELKGIPSADTDFLIGDGLEKGIIFGRRVGIGGLG